MFQPGRIAGQARNDVIDSLIQRRRIAGQARNDVIASLILQLRIAGQARNDVGHSHPVCANTLDGLRVKPAMT